MAQDNRELLEALRFELSFLEDGGYGRSPHTPWRPPSIFEDSPICLNFSDASKPHPCNQCLLEKFVPVARRNEDVPCRFVPITAEGQTIDDFYRTGTQIEMEEALAKWLRAQIQKLESGTSAKEETAQAR